MTCNAPPGGIERVPKKPECTSDRSCDGVRSPLHKKCVANKCVMKYKRLVDVGMMTTQDYHSNTCSNMGIGWDEVSIDTTDSLGNNIRGATSDAKIRLCAKYSEEPVDDKDAATHGVCRMLLSSSECVEHEGFNFQKVERGGESNGDIGQFEHDPALWLCRAKDGCEGRGLDDPKNPRPALSQIGLARNKEGRCPKTMHKGRGISTLGGLTGDFNENMNSGGDVWMCEERAKS